MHLCQILCFQPPRLVLLYALVAAARLRRPAAEGVAADFLKIIRNARIKNVGKHGSCMGLSTDLSHRAIALPPRELAVGAPRDQGRLRGHERGVEDRLLRGLAKYPAFACSRFERINMNQAAGMHASKR